MQRPIDVSPQCPTLLCWIIGLKSSHMAIGADNPVVSQIIIIRTPHNLTRTRIQVDTQDALAKGEE